MIKQFFLLFIFCVSLAYSTSHDVVSYSYAGNFKGWLRNPFKTGQHPVIIYNYDHYYDWAGKQVANEKGYKLEEFMRVFESLGYISFIPVERYRKANAIKGAVQYLSTLPTVDKNNIHIVGMGEGAFMSLLVLNDLPHVSSVTLIAPENVNTTGYFSFPSVARRINGVSTPMLLLISEEEPLWRLHTQLILEQLFSQHELNTLTYRYPVNKEWFFDHRHFYINDIHYFIKGLNHESKNTY